MDKVAIYCRLSEEDRDKLNKTDDSESIKNQKSMLLKYAMQQGWEVYNIYSDDDYAGADRKRPEFNRLLHDAEEGKFDIVLCKTQSRFTRELELVEKYIHGFKERLRVKQGLTGHAQVMGGYDLKPEEKIVYDVEYIKNRSFLIDMRIILKTIGVVLKREGAK